MHDKTPALISSLVFLLLSIPIQLALAIPASATSSSSSSNLAQTTWGPAPPGGWDYELSVQTRPSWFLSAPDTVALLANIAADPSPDYAIIAPPSETATTWNRTLPGNSAMFTVEPIGFARTPLYFGVVRAFAQTVFPDTFKSMHIEPPCWMQIIDAITKSPKGTKAGLYGYAKFTLGPVTVPAVGVSNRTVTVAMRKMGNGEGEGEDMVETS